MSMIFRTAFLSATVVAWVASGHAADVPQATAAGAPAVAAASLTPLSLTTIGKNTFMVRDPLTLTFKDGAPALTVPAGFVTDLSSLPKGLRMWDGKADAAMAPAVLHDYLYWVQPCTQDEADAVLVHAIGALGASPSKAAAAFQSINSAGAAAFKRNADRRRNGEVRTFTVAYAQSVVQTANFDAGATLESALRKAQSADGLVRQEAANQAVKLTCARLLHQCKACADHVARKKAPRARVAKGG
jgi:hypothetical protein